MVILVSTCFPYCILFLCLNFNLVVYFFLWLKLKEKPLFLLLLVIEEKLFLIPWGFDFVYHYYNYILLVEYDFYIWWIRLPSNLVIVARKLQKLTLFSSFYDQDHHRGEPLLYNLERENTAKSLRKQTKLRRRTCQ